MSEAEVHKCSFCGIVQSADTPLIAGMDGHICESCVTLAHQVVSSWGRRRVLTAPLKTPPSYSARPTASVTPCSSKPARAVEAKACAS